MRRGVCRLLAGDRVETRHVERAVPNSAMVSDSPGDRNGIEYSPLAEESVSERRSESVWLVEKTYNQLRQLFFPRRIPLQSGKFPSKYLLLIKLF
jgi:hypothetical protein